MAESAATSTPALDTDLHAIRQGAAIAVTAEETACATCPQGLVVVPVQPPPSFVLAIACRHGDHPALPGRFSGFVRAYPDAHGWLVDTPGLSPARQHLLDGLWLG